MRKVILAVLIAGCLYSLFATGARVLTMGRSDHFFMDDISIFYNPANTNIYPNMLIGDLGTYVYDEELDEKRTKIFISLDTITHDTLYAENRYNRDPQRPYFGGIVSYSLNKSSEAGDQYPMLSLGAILNRYDDLLSYLDPESEDFFGIGDTSKKQYLQKDNFVEPVGKIDVMLGFATKTGAMFGIGTYFAFQKQKDDNDVQREMKLIKGNVGVNVPVAKTVDLECSVSGGVMSQIGKDSLIDEIIITKNDFFVSGDVRLFSALSALNGDFVPHIGFKIMKFNEGEQREFGFNAGFGININIDRGFFWTGIEGFYKDNDSKMLESSIDYERVQTMGGRISFGIERNIIWDWLVWRLGATKMLAVQSVGGMDGSTQWLENPEANGSDKDHVAFGWAINIENRLKIDAIFAEDVFHTFSNLFSGNHHHLFTRFSATYSF
jgi:hypothetical protein